MYVVVAIPGPGAPAGARILGPYAFGPFEAREGAQAWADARNPDAPNGHWRYYVREVSMPIEEVTA